MDGGRGKRRAGGQRRDGRRYRYRRRARAPFCLLVPMAARTAGLHHRRRPTSRALWFVSTITPRSARLDPRRDCMTKAPRTEVG